MPTVEPPPYLLAAWEQEEREKEMARAQRGSMEQEGVGIEGGTGTRRSNQTQTQTPEQEMEPVQMQDSSSALERRRRRRRWRREQQELLAAQIMQGTKAQAQGAQAQHSLSDTVLTSSSAPPAGQQSSMSGKQTLTEQVEVREKNGQVFTKMKPVSSTFVEIIEYEEEEPQEEEEKANKRRGKFQTSSSAFTTIGWAVS